MLFQRYMTGRGNLGYGFRAQTKVTPQAPYMKLRASDTGDTKRLLLEIMTTSHGELAAIGSRYDREQGNGLTDILFPLADGSAEFQALLENPGRLLYLPHITKDEFLEISNKGKNVSLGDNLTMELPQVTHAWDGHFQIDQDTLADLAADLWYAASMRLNNPTSPTQWPKISLWLTDESNAEQIIDMGREFYCNVLMPALPAALRPILSVAIGGRWSDMSNDTNGGAAALLISLPDGHDGLFPGCYNLTSGNQNHQSLNPLGDQKRWKEFGKAVLHFTNGTVETAQGTDTYLNDFFALSKILLSDEKYASFRQLTYNWPFAYLLYNAHVNAEDAANHQGDYEDQTAQDEIQEAFADNVWETADVQAMSEFGFSKEESRSAMVWLEADMVQALLENLRLSISPEWYAQLVQRAFTLNGVSMDATSLRRMSQNYDDLLLRGNPETNTSAARMLLDDLCARGQTSLFEGQERRLAVLVEKALNAAGNEAPADEYLHFLASFAKEGDVEEKIVSSYAVRLLKEEILPLSKLCLFRSVQNGSELDQAVIDYVKNNTYGNREETSVGCMNSDFRTVLKTYAETLPASEALSENNVKKSFAQIIGPYFVEHADDLAQIRQALAEIGLKDSTDSIEILSQYLQRHSFSTTDASAVSPILESDADYAESMATSIFQAFQQNLPSILNGASGVEQPWLSCTKMRNPSQTQQKLAANIESAILQWTQGNPFAFRLERAAELLQEFGQPDSTAVPELCCVVMEARTTLTKSEDLLNQVELQVLGSPAMQQMREEQKQRLTAALLHLFGKALPAVMRSENEHAVWNGLLKNNYFAADLKEPMAQAATAYLQQEQTAADLCNDPETALNACSDFGLNGSQQLNVWFALLMALEKKSNGMTILRNGYVAAFTLEMAQQMDDEACRQMADFFQADLSKMLQGSGISEWTELNRKLNSAYTSPWKMQAPKVFCKFIEKQTELVSNSGEQAPEDQLLNLLHIADAFGWQTEKDVCNALVGYLAAWKRDRLSEEEMESLLTRRAFGSQLDGELQQIFQRSVPRLLNEAIEGENQETYQWQPAAKQIDFRIPFQEALKCLPAEIQQSLRENTILPLLEIGSLLNGLLQSAAEQAIGLIEARKNDLASAEHRRIRLLSAEEHEKLRSIMEESHNQELLRRYIDLLAYQPVDAENAENEASLRNELRAMRTSLFPLMDNSIAHKVNGMGSPWQEELRSAILAQLEMMTALGQSFEHLCQVPQRWSEECKALPFLEFSQLPTYFSNRMEELKNTAAKGAATVIDATPLTQLLRNPLKDSESWFGKLICTLVSQRLDRDATLLVGECDSPQAAHELLQAFDGTFSEGIFAAQQALEFVLAGSKGASAKDTFARLKHLDHNTRETALPLLQKALFGQQREKWSSLWKAEGISGEIALAVMCFLGGQERNWEDFFQQIFQNSLMEQQALSQGRDAVQTLLFTASVLRDFGLKEDAEELAEQFKNLRPSEFLYARGMGLKRRELSALRKKELWQEAELPESLYELLFQKR